MQKQRQVPAAGAAVVEMNLSTLRTSGNILSAEHGEEKTTLAALAVLFMLCFEFFSRKPARPRKRHL